MRHSYFNKIIIIIALPITLSIVLLTMYIFMNIINNDSSRAVLPGLGTYKDPYIIENEQDFELFAATLTDGSSPYIYSYVKLMSDLDFSEMEINIPYSADGIMFFGIFEGNGHTIKGLKVDNGENPCGLFPDLSGTVCNLHITESEFAGGKAGGICGLLRSTGKIYNCYSDAIVNGIKHSGGIAGDCYGRIENCVSREECAGIIEKNANVINCFDLEADNELLNDYIPNILENQGIYSWKEDLSFDSYVNTVHSLELVFGKGIAPNRYGAFFSIPERKYIFSLPGSMKRTSYRLLAKLSDGSMEQFSGGDVGEIVLKNGIEYEYQIIYTDNMSSLFVSFNREDGRKYLSYLKTNELKGSLVVTDEKGDISLKDYNILLSGRGNDSFRSDKPGYNLELKASKSIAGMEADKKYCLLPGYRDDSMFSYIYTRDLFKKMNFEYSPEYKMVNLYLDGEYCGVYMLTESVEISKAAFDLTDMGAATRNKNTGLLYTYLKIEEGGVGRDADRVYYNLPAESDDITGGYIVAINYNDYLQKRSRFRTNRNMMITIKSDQFLGYNQMNYIQNKWQRLEDAIISPDGYNDEGEYYADLIDMECFADQWLFYELVMEQSMDDSIYYYKDSDTIDPRFHAVWYWDAEHAFLSYKKAGKQHIKMKISDELKNGGDLKSGVQFFNALATHQDFVELLKKEWQLKYYPVLSDEEYYKQYETEYPEGVLIDDLCYGTDYREKVKYVKGVLEERLLFMNSVYGSN